MTVTGRGRPARSRGDSGACTVATRTAPDSVTRRSVIVGLGVAGVLGTSAVLWRSRPTGNRQLPTTIAVLPFAPLIGGSRRRGARTRHGRHIDQPTECPAWRRRDAVQFGAALCRYQSEPGVRRARAGGSRGHRRPCTGAARSRALDGPAAASRRRQRALERQFRRAPERLLFGPGFARPATGGCARPGRAGRSTASAGAELHRRRRGLAAVPERALSLGYPHDRGRPAACA